VIPVRSSLTEDGFTSWTCYPSNGSMLENWSLNGQWAAMDTSRRNRATSYASHLVVGRLSCHCSSMSTQGEKVIA
jgi:hypothetical protein